MLIGTKVYKLCPKCGKENEIQHEVTKNQDKYWWHCGNTDRHPNLWIEKTDVADVIDNLDKMNESE